MTEKITPVNTPEKSFTGHETLSTLKQEAEPSKERVEAHKPTKKEVEGLRELAAEQAAPTSETQPKKIGNNSSRDTFLSRDVKDDRYKRTMAQTRQRLSKPEALFSKFIHAQPVDKASEIAANTIGRPSALAGGGLFAAIGVVVAGWYARRNGFELSGYEFVLLILIGALAGVALEFLKKFLALLFKK
mgnify:CR=1 FL=1